MAFQIKDFSSIAASAVNWMRTATTKVTDFNVGSVVRTLIEAVAAEIDELYQQMFIGLREAIPVSVYNSFDFEALEAVAASGLVRVTVTSSASSILIPSGTTFTVAGSQATYTAIADVTIAPGNTYGDVSVVADSAGASGNVSAGSAFTPNPAPANFLSATNLAAFSNGGDAETDEQRKVRFVAYIASLPRGTVAALEYGLKTTVRLDSAGNEIERVATVSVVEPWIADNNQPIALVNCYVHNGVGGTSAALVTLARQIAYGYYDAAGNAVPGWKAAGVKVEVYAATETAVAVTAVLTAAAGYDKPTLVTAASQAIAAYLLSLKIGEPAIRSEIIAIAMNIDGVTNFVATLPAGDTSAASSVKLMPGTITIT